MKAMTHAEINQWVNEHPREYEEWVRATVEHLTVNRGFPDDSRTRSIAEQCFSSVWENYGPEGGR